LEPTCKQIISEADFVDVCGTKDYFIDPNENDYWPGPARASEECGLVDGKKIIFLPYDLIKAGKTRFTELSLYGDDYYSKTLSPRSKDKYIIEFLPDVVANRWSERAVITRIGAQESLVVYKRDNNIEGESCSVEDLEQISDLVLERLKDKSKWLDHKISR